MVIWMSDRFHASLGLDAACMADRTDKAVTHDNMFSTVLDLLDVVTVAEDEGLDLAAACRKRAS
jgi:lipid A ethanolaminephosphotransferase